MLKSIPYLVEGHLEIADELITAAENELGALTLGQLTDLLADNTCWGLSYCRSVASACRPLAAGEHP